MTITGQAAWERRERWVAGMGGWDSPRYRALLCEALDFAGPDDVGEYLDMAQQIDEDHEAYKRARASARVRAAVARRRAELAASAVLQRANEIQFAAETVLSDPRLADDPDFGTGPERSRAEIEADAMYAMGLATRAPSAYLGMLEKLPPVGDLARMIGVR